MKQSTFSLPPVEADLYLTLAPIDVAGLLTRSRHRGTGALVLFCGDVREQNRGKEVIRLEYEAHEHLAHAMIADIVRAANDTWDLKRVIAIHRLGPVDVGETAVVVITASAHREEAYAANRFIVERIKHEVPVWKCEFYADGTHAWGNNCGCAGVTGDPAMHIYEQSK